MDDFNQLVSISELPRKYYQLLQRASNSNEPIILLRRNRPVGGLLAYQLLQELLEAKKKLELEDALKMIKEGEEAYRIKKTKILRKPPELFRSWSKSKR